MGRNLTHRTLEPFGSKVEGDLSAPLSEPDETLLKSLMRRDGLVVARGQRLSLQRQMEILSLFGPVLGSRATLNYVAPDDGVLGAGPLAYHSDLAFAPQPFDFISLHAVDVEDGQTCTRFVSGGRAYDRLSESQRLRLEGLTAAAVSSSAAGRRVGYRVPAKAIRYDREAVLAHPATGRPVLYVNEGQTARFNELDEAESDNLLSELFEVLYAPDAVYEHAWRTGDLVIWDNILLQHGRPALDGVVRRKLQRVVVAERSLYEQVPDFRPGDPTD
jgi:taurine dioxygenase